MGRPVVYCDKCGKMLREEDFLRGNAHTFENRNFCSDCRPLEALLAPPPPQPTSSTPKPFKQVSSTRIPKAPSGQYRAAHPEAAPPPPPPPPPPSRTGLIVGVVVVVLVVGGLGVAMMSGGNDRRQRDETQDVKVVSDPGRTTRDRDRDADRPPPDDPGKAAFAKAADFSRLNPTDLVGRFKAYDEVVQQYGSSPIAELARRELQTIRRKFTDEIGQVNDQARVPLGAEDFKGSIAVWERAKSRYAHPDWTRPIDEKIAEANVMALARLGTVRDQAVESKKKNDLKDVQAKRDRVAKWEIPGYLEEFDRAIAAVTADKPETPDKPPVPVVLPAVEAYRAAWKEAVFLAARHEYEAALPALQKAVDAAKAPELKAETTRDLEDFALVGKAAIEARSIAAKAAKGQKVQWAFTDSGGGAASVDGVVAACDGARVEVKRGEESVLLLVGELSGPSLAELLRSRTPKQPTDARAAALLCLMEGDLEGAKKVAVDPPPAEKYSALAGEAGAAAKTVAPKEGEARKAFAEAEAAYFDPVRAAESVRMYRSLLADFADTGFVRRNKGAIAPRAEGVRDQFFGAADLGASNNFKLAKHGAVEAWISTKDLDAAQMKDSYVQVDFAAVAETEYALWVRLGGCCQEVFTCFVQGTDLSAPNPKKTTELIAVPPGGEAVGLLKVPYSTMKKRHVDHTGPKEPDRWEWVQVPLQKYAMGGVKTVRLLTLSKGFSVASAVVAAGKSGVPKESDWKEWERFKAETPGYALYRSQSQTGGILREFWLGIQGGEVPLLLSHPNYPDKPTGFKVESSFEAPRDWADDYGQRMRGWVHPPVTGKYIFWIASDDKGELWLSSDDTADKPKLTKIGVVPDYTAPNEWGKHGSQQSQPIELVAGRRYYIEAFQKEGGGGDNLSVGWQLPDGRQERPIPGNRLSPWKKR